MNIFSCDPGLSGACAALDEHGGLIAVFDLPVIGDAKQRRIDAATLADLIREHTPYVFAIVEMAHAMPKQGVAGVFRYGATYGCVLGVIGALRIPIRHAAPTKWKRALGLDNTGETSRARAIETWPDRVELFARKMDHHRSEAALLGLYALKAGA